ncbi:uncharacterized protein LOC130719076 [Lotus japonicus]|uniref:uncharacterized protein LOC130719076 n=1 Tax=Lotus japonicus TaxID=34305 RepID=UPI00258C0D71|nr:uncharacterized protein LOC130719076 [Lotus japonicus]
MGCTTTNRVEGAHSKLKKLLSDSKGDLVIAWTAMNKLIIMQHDKIKESFQLSIFITEHSVNDPFYKHLRGFVSRAALHIIVKEKTQIGRIGVGGIYCECVLRRTHGLPCACELMKFESVSLLAIHPHWRKLTWDSSDRDMDPTLGLSFESEFDKLRTKFEESSHGVRMSIIESLRMITYPETTSMCAPTKKKTRGRPMGSTNKPKKFAKGCGETSTKRIPCRWETIDKEYPSSWRDSNTTPLQEPSPNVKSQKVPKVRSQKASKASKLPSQKPPKASKVQSHLIRMVCTKDKKPVSSYLRRRYLKQIPDEFHPFVVDFINVKGDGHCGYRCVASLKGLAEDDWPLIRRELLTELDSDANMYINMFGASEVNQMRLALTVKDTKPVGEDKWMMIPNMAYLISTKYKFIVLTIANIGCNTFYPLKGKTDLVEEHKFMPIVLVNKDHFVGVTLREGHPMPTTAHLWAYNCHPEAKKREEPYKERIEEYAAYLKQKNGGCSDIIDLSDD